MAMAESRRQETGDRDLLFFCLLSPVFCFLSASVFSDSDIARSRQEIAKEQALQVEKTLRGLIARYAGQPDQKDKKERMEKALEQLAQARVENRMEEVLRAIEGSDFASARSAAGEASRGLREILETLTQSARLDEIGRKRKMLDKAIENLEGLSGREQEIVDRAKALRDGAVPASLREIKERLDALTRSQADLAERTEIARALAEAKSLLSDQRTLAAASSKTGDPGKPKDAAAAQGELARRADELAGRLDALSAAGASTDPAPAARSAAQAAEGARESKRQMDQAAHSLAQGDPKQASDHQQSAAEHLERLIGRLDPSLAARQGELAKQAEALARQLEEAVDRASRSGPAPEAALRERKSRSESAASKMDASSQQMKKAGQAMDQPESLKEAPGLQRQAIESLAAAREEIDRLERTFLDPEDRVELARLIRKQQEAAQQAKQLLDALKLDQELGRDLEAPMHKAADQMAIVEGLLREEFVDSGIWEAQKALRYLADALGSARRKEREYATEQSKVVLSRLQADLDRLIAAQKEIRAKTAGLVASCQDKGALGVWEREEARSLAQRERELIDTATDLGRRLGDPNLKSVVYAWVAAQAQERMEKVHGMLAREEATEANVRTQDEVIELWNQMLEGLKGLLGRLDEDPRRKPRPMAGSGDLELPLVRPVDEVRLLLSLQKDLNARFERFGRRVGSAQAMDPAARAQLEALTQDQERIRNLGEEWRMKTYGEQR